MAPDGARVELSDSDVAVLESFVEASGDVVSRDDLRKRLGLDSNDEATDALTAYIYRLRRRIERATPTLVPLQSRSRIGYVFRAPLVAV
jgi:DNA-binding response OmpR family regulator